MSKQEEIQDVNNDKTESQINEEKANAYYWKGNALQKFGMYHESIEAYSEAIEIEPINFKAYIGKFEFQNLSKGFVQYREFLHDQDTEQYSKAIEIDPQFLSLIIIEAIIYNYHIGLLNYILLQYDNQDIFIQNQIQFMKLLRILIRQLRWTQNQLFQQIQKKLLRPIIYTLRHYVIKFLLIFLTIEVVQDFQLVSLLEYILYFRENSIIWKL